MRYESTRGGAGGRSFTDVLLEGLAPDGGLYVPEEIPRLTESTLRGLAEDTFAEVATERASESEPDEVRSCDVPHSEHEGALS